MELRVDGVLYAPVVELENVPELKKALEVRFDSDAGDNITVRDYLFELLDTLWFEEEGFNGKRPYVNSGWQYDVYHALAKAGFIASTTNRWGDTVIADEGTAGDYVRELIKLAFYG